MDDEETKKEDKPEKPEEDTDDGDKSKTPQSIIDANAAAKRLEEATAKHKEQLDRQEDMIARKILGGTTEAGAQPVKESEEEKWAKKAKERYEGTGMDPTPDDSQTTYK